MTFESLIIKFRKIKTIEKLDRFLRYYLRFLDYQHPKIARILKNKFDFKGKTMIDLGCDDGALEILLGKYFSKVVALDINPLAIASNKKLIKLKNIQFVQEDLEKIDKKKYGQFDFVFYMNMVYVLKFDKSMIKRLISFLNQKGILVIFAPNISESKTQEIIQKLNREDLNLTFKKGLFYHPAKKHLSFHLSYLKFFLETFFPKKKPEYYLLAFERA